MRRQLSAIQGSRRYSSKNIRQVLHELNSSVAMLQRVLHDEEDFALQFAREFRKLLVGVSWQKHYAVAKAVRWALVNTDGAIRDLTANTN